jgi:hypothetical protein
MKSHFIFENHVEGFEDFGKLRKVFGFDVVGFDAYLIIKLNALEAFKVVNGYLCLTTKNSVGLPKKFKLEMAGVLELSFDADGLLIVLDGCNYQTQKVASLEFDLFD